MQVVFIHPDLGIGGAERLVVDAALALKSKGHRVNFITAHHDKKHCFEETKDGTFSVTTVGDWIPLNVMGRFHALFAYIKMIYLALYLIFVSSIKPDVVFCDQISICIPFLRWGTSAKIVFYCHFPDKLLTDRKSFLKRLYRKPIDWVEEQTTGMAHLLLVNSHFTATIFRSAFSSLSSLETHVLHPSLNTASFDSALRNPLQVSAGIIPTSARHVFLSVNRYERKKNLKLAIDSLKRLSDKLTREQWRGVHLVVAGGYDERIEENVQYYKYLCKISNSLRLDDKITFCRSVKSDVKIALLKSACAVLYTPDNEHFGIVPVEAMYLETPVIAVDSGGPRETVVNDVTGFLCESSPDKFSDAMRRFVEETNLSKQMGQAGKRRVQTSFSFEQFAISLSGIIQSILT